MRSSSDSSHKSSLFSTSILPWFVCGMGALFYCYEFILRVAPSIMAIDMMSFYKIGAADFAILTSYYYYAYTPMQIVVGLLMDHYGPRKLLCMSILACILGSFFISAFPELYLGKVGFFAMGFGSSFAFVGVLKLAVNWLPHNRFSFVAGLTTTLGLLGGIYVQSMLSYSLDVLSWRHIWYYAAFAGIIIYIITFLTVRDHPKHKLPEVANIPEASWKILFIDLISIFKNHRFIINGFIGCILYLPVSFFAGLWAFSFFEQGVNIQHEVVVKLVPLVFLGMAVSGPLTGILSEYVGRRKIFYQSSLFLSLFIFITVVYVPGLPIYLLAILLFLLGFVSGSQILVFAIGIELIDNKASGTAAACTNFLVMVGGMLLSPLFGRLLDYTWDGSIINNAPVYSLYSYQIALFLLVLCYSIAFILSFLLHDTHPKAIAKKLASDEDLLVLKK